MRRDSFFKKDPSSPLLLTTWSNKAALMKSYCECFITMSLIPTTITQHQLNIVLVSERRKQIPNTLLSYT